MSAQIILEKTNGGLHRVKETINTLSHQVGDYLDIDAVRDAVDNPNIKVVIKEKRRNELQMWIR